MLGSTLRGNCKAMTQIRPRPRYLIWHPRADATAADVRDVMVEARASVGNWLVLADNPVSVWHLNGQTYPMSTNEAVHFKLAIRAGHSAARAIREPEAGNRETLSQ
jgi:hypothetical protein